MRRGIRGLGPRRWALLLPVALLLVGGAAGGAPLHAQRPRAACSGDADCEAMRDYMAELAKLRAEVNALVRQQQKLQASSTRRGEEVDALQDQIRYAVRKLARLQSRLSKDKDADSRAESSAQIAQLGGQLGQLADRQQRLAQQTQQGQFSQELTRTPRAQARGQSAVVVPGYLGVVYTSQGTQFVRNGAVIVNHPDYPVVESVEPGSPAERAGVVSGDTIIAYNRRDLRNRDISLTEILQPGTKLLVTVKRDGRVRTVPVMVADRSENPEIPDWNAGPAVAAAPAAPPVRIRVAPTPPVAQLAPLTATIQTGRSSLVLAGAEFMRMNDDLREFFDVRSGVLVYSVGARTMAAQAGLRGGDVVVSVNDTKVSTPDDIERIVARGGDRTARLGIVRKGREQTVSLRW